MPDGRSLLPETIVTDWRIERLLGAGGFGITYESRHRATEEHAALKEYMPSGCCSRVVGSSKVTAHAGREGEVFRWGRERFIREAETLARLEHPSIVRVADYFEANGTAYIALGFEEGGTLRDWLARLGRPPTEAEIDGIVDPLIDALIQVHSLYLQHRDIKPDNVVLRHDGTPVLIDFGAVRSAIAGHTTAVGGVNPAATSAFAIVSHGYSPPEQYDPAGVNMGPASDIYALGATLHFALTGEPPPAAPSRIFGDPYVPLVRRLADLGWRPALLAGIDRALAADPRVRPQSAIEWRRELGLGSAGRPIKSHPRLDGAPKSPVGATVTFAPHSPRQGTDEGASRARNSRAGLSAPADDGPGVSAAVGHTDGPARGDGIGASRARLASAAGLASLLLAGISAWGLLPGVAGRIGRPPGPVAALLPGSGQSARDCWQQSGRELCGPEMVALPAGTFRMGTPGPEIEALKKEYPAAASQLDREAPARAVLIRRPFAVGRSHVTRGEFAEFVRDTKRQMAAGGCAVFIAGKFEFPVDTTWQSPGYQQDDRHPVVCVDFHDAEAYAKWLADKTGKPYRLLTEAEAEYAARGVTSSTDAHPSWWFGNDVRSLCAHANGADQTGAVVENWSAVAPCPDGFVYTAPIGSFRANAFGLHDVAGNVWTWTQDCWNDDYRDALSDERARTGDCSRRALRGGSWLSGPRLLRAAHRFGDAAGGRARTFGFRIARSLP